MSRHKLLQGTLRATYPKSDSAPMDRHPAPTHPPTCGMSSPSSPMQVATRQLKAPDLQRQCESNGWGERAGSGALCKAVGFASDSLITQTAAERSHREFPACRWHSVSLPPYPPEAVQHRLLLLLAHARAAALATRPLAHKGPALRGSRGAAVWVRSRAWEAGRQGGPLLKGFLPPRQLPQQHTPTPPYAP